MSSPLTGCISRAAAVICFTYIVQKFEFQTTDCSKQIPDLLTAVYISKGTQWTIGKSIVLCVWLGFGLDFAKKKCLMWKPFTAWTYTKKLMSKSNEKDTCYLQIMNFSQKISFDTMSCPLAGHITSASAVICFTYIVQKS